MLAIVVTESQTTKGKTILYLGHYLSWYAKNCGDDITSAKDYKTDTC